MTRYATIARPLSMLPALISARAMMSTNGLEELLSDLYSFLVLQQLLVENSEYLSLSKPWNSHKVSISLLSLHFFLKHFFCILIEEHPYPYSPSYPKSSHNAASSSDSCARAS